MRGRVAGLIAVLLVAGCTGESAPSSVPSSSTVPVIERRIGFLGRVVEVEFGDEYTMTPGWRNQLGGLTRVEVSLGPAIWITADGSRVEVAAGARVERPPVCDELMSDDDVVAWSGDPAYMVDVELVRGELEPCVVAAEVDDAGQVVWFEVLPYSGGGRVEIPGNLLEVRGDGTAVTSEGWVLPVADDVVLNGIAPHQGEGTEALKALLEEGSPWHDLFVDLDSGELAEVVCIVRA